MYYVIQWTWGLPLNIIGAIVWLVLTICGHRSYWYRNAICTPVRWNFGGVSMGMFIVRGQMCESIMSHEYGHTIQNMQWGWLAPIVIAIPSACRYWWREFYMAFIYKRTRKSLPAYDSIWFEWQATEYGKRATDDTWNWL